MGIRSEGRTPRSGFTLIELLIVIAIIGTLAGMIVAGIARVKGRARQSQAVNDINSVFVSGIKTFNFDMGFYPAFDQDCDEDELEDFNSFPILYENLNGEKAPEGKGGKNTPYAEGLKAESLVVEDEAELTGWRSADNDEIYDPDVEKFYLDPWGNPYFYRENDSKKKRRDWMINPKSFDFWSIGPNNINEACYGRDESGDDVGNW